MDTVTNPIFVGACAFGDNYSTLLGGGVYAEGFFFHRLLCFRNRSRVEGDEGTARSQGRATAGAESRGRMAATPGRGRTGWQAPPGLADPGRRIPGLRGKAEGRRIPALIIAGKAAICP